VVPEDAVLPLQGANFVWVAKDGKATRRQVELGVRTPGWVEAKRGIDRGDLVVVGGQERLSEGARVAPKPVERAPAARQEG
jgi:membrane fusion protein (multidrug efflux system)